jgi:SAM-dependent methyltransferase
MSDPGPAAPAEQLKHHVRRHWEAHPCGSDDAQTEETGTPAYFAAIEARRFKLEPFIPAFAEFPRWAGKRVLEIGVGQGTDFVRFARAGANCTGVDLTDAAISLVRRRLKQENLDATLVQADAEKLPFSDRSFDLVYSWGVLHHMPSPSKALAEARRVLAPSGEARIMLYSRRSWTALWCWARYALARGRPFHSFSEILAEHMESPGTKAYTVRELRALFAEWHDVTYTRWLTPYDRRLVPPIVDMLGSRFGWFVGVRARPSPTSADG